MGELIGFIIGILFLFIIIDMMFMGQLGLTGGFIGLLMQILISVFQAVIQVAMQLIGVFVPILVQITGNVLKYTAKGLGWTLNQGFKGGNRLLFGKKLLILGPGESLKPGVSYNELYDYSQTANKQEASNLALGNANNGDFWLGNYVEISNNSCNRRLDVWLPHDYLHQHLLIVGATGAGKTEFLLKSAENLMNISNLIVVDAAGFLSARLFPMTQKTGSRLMTWDISNRNHRIVWNFLEELEKYGTEQEIRALAEALYGDINDNDQNAAFWVRDIGWLTAILGVVVSARKQNIVKIKPSELPELLVDRNGMRALLQHCFPNPYIMAQWEAKLSYLSLPDDRFGLDISFLLNKLTPFQDRDVKAICDGKSDLYLLSSFNGKNRHTLVIGQSLADGKFGSALAAVMIRYLMNVMYRRLRNPQHNWIPTYFICDEAARLKNLNYEELTAIGRNAKAGVVLMCQHIDQFSDKTLPALNNCRTQIFLQGVSHKTAEWLSQQLGEYSRQIITMINQGVVGANPFGQRNVGFERIPILGIREITSHPYAKLRSNRSAIVRINASNSPVTKPFLTDYSVK